MIIDTFSYIYDTLSLIIAYMQGVYFYILLAFIVVAFVAAVISGAYELGRRAYGVIRPKRIDRPL